MTNPATSSDTLFFNVCLSVTGIVAADEAVPSAVKYAGIMVARSLKGFRLVTAPARRYCKMRATKVMIKMTTMIFRNVASTTAICPSAAIFKKMPKI